MCIQEKKSAISDYILYCLLHLLREKNQIPVSLQYKKHFPLSSILGYVGRFNGAQRLSLGIQVSSNNISPSLSAYKNILIVHSENNYF